MFDRIAQATNTRGDMHAAPALPRGGTRTFVKGALTPPCSNDNLNFPLLSVVEWLFCVRVWLLLSTLVRSFAWRFRREFREQQKESSISSLPKSRSSSVEAGQIEARGPSPAGVSRAVRSTSRGRDHRSSKRERGRGASVARRSRSRDLHRSRDRSEARTPTEGEETARRQREAERRERDRKEREEDRTRREARLAREREERRKRDREDEERRRRFREERGRKEWAKEAIRLASDIESLCDDCTMQNIMKCAALHPSAGSSHLHPHLTPTLTQAHHTAAHIHTQLPALSSSEIGTVLTYSLL